MQPKSIERIPGGIKLLWADGSAHEFSAQELRRRCPCAVCKEIPERDEIGLPLHGLPAEGVGIAAAHPVGWYALQFQFTDGHDTGIYSYELLRKWGQARSES